MIALTAVIVRFPTYLSSRPLSFDDGVYGASTVALRHGQAPYREVWSSQGPLHLPLLYVGDLVGLRTPDAPRTTAILSAIVTAVAIWACARLLGATDATAFVAGLLAATTGTMLWAAGQITGDGPAVALSAVAAWCALRYRATPHVGWAVGTGVMFGAAVATKPIVIAALAPTIWWLAERRRVPDLLAAILAVPLTWIAAALPWGLGRVWDQSIVYHRRAGPAYGVVTQLAKLAQTVTTRDAILLAAVTLGLCALTRSAIQPDTIVLGSWAVIAATVLVFEKAMFANHVATLIIPLALLAALHPPPVRAFIVALVVLAPWQLANQRDILWPQRLTGVDAEVVADLRTLPPGSVVVADDPGLVWRAGLSTPPLMSDTTDMRVFQGSLTTPDIIATDACAVVITPAGFGTLLPDLRDALRTEHFTLQRAYGADREFWRKPIEGC